MLASNSELELSLDELELEVALVLLVVAEDDELPEDAEEETDKKDFISRLNPDSLKVVRGAAERVVAGAETGATFQFLRTGYFCKDPDSTDELPVYNRAVGLRDTFAKQNR